MISNKTTSIKQNQSGLVAIVVTLMIMMIVTLITLTFSKIIRREQRQSLDRQLNTQAFYAAESGINDAIKAIKGGYIGSKPDCAPLTAPFNPESNPADLQYNSVDSANGTEYTCLTIDNKPFSLEYDDIDVNQSTIIPVKAEVNIDSITIAWQSKSGSTDYNCGSLATFSQYSPGVCDTGVLRLDIVPAAGAISRSGLLSNSRTVFLIPSDSGDNAYAFGSSISGDKDEVRCVADPSSKACKVTISGLGSTLYYLRVRSIYANSSLTVTATNGATALRLIGVQAIVDSTGKANDVLRRIQVRVPLKSNGIVPDFAIQSTDTICKRLRITSTTAEFDDPAITDVDTDSCSP